MEPTKLLFTFGQSQFLFSLSFLKLEQRVQNTMGTATPLLYLAQIGAHHLDLSSLLINFFILAGAEKEKVLEPKGFSTHYTCANNEKQL